MPPRKVVNQPPSAPRAAAEPAIWQRVEELCRAAIRITAERDLDTVLQQIADSAREVVGARYAALGVLNQSRDALDQFLVSGVTAEQFAAIGDLPKGKGILGVLIEDPRPLRLKAIGAHGRSYGFPPNHPPMNSFLGVPILGRTAPIGNLYLTEKLGADEFTYQDEAFAVMLAAHAAVAVENARFNQERDRLMGELRTMQASRDRFFAMINHELRNALTAVHGWAELWIRKVRPDIPRPAQEVYESSERAIHLLEDLLDLSRLEAAKLQPRIKECDAPRVIGEAVASVEPAAERRGVRVDLRLPDTELACRTDPQRVRQILINLLTNAIRHSPDGEVVRIEVETLDHKRVRVHVIDRGPGIAAERQAVIFEAFERGTDEIEKGTGLGLALSRRLARLLRGDLTVESAVGAGARFTLELPLELEDY